MLFLKIAVLVTVSGPPIVAVPPMATPLLTTKFDAIDALPLTVSVEETVAQNLREEDFNPGAGQFGKINPGVDQRLPLADRQAVHAFHDHDRGGGLPLR